MKPAWLAALTAETPFHEVCGLHENRKKNDKNIFCLDCCLSICHHCVLSNHQSHPLLQVRRYLYQPVVRLDDLEKMINCAYVQSYTTNSKKVVFLRQRTPAQQRPVNNKNSTQLCFTCDRILQEPFTFCCISCKVDYMELKGGDISSILWQFNASDFSFSLIEGIKMDGLDVPEDNGIHEAGTSSQAVEVNVKKGSKRKGTPHRSPFF